MYRPTVTLKGCGHYSDAQTWLDEKETRLNLPTCAKMAEKHGIDFCEFVARCLNHEFLHHLFYEEQNRDTSRALDNIAKRLKDF